MGGDNVAAIPDSNKPKPRLPDQPLTPPPARPWGIDEVVVAAFAFLGVGGAVLLQVMSKTIAPVIVSYLLATGLAALTYRFLGGIEGTTTLKIGALKLTGALAALVGIAMLVNQQLASQMKPPPQYQLWEVSGQLSKDSGGPVEPLDVKDFSLEPSNFEHPGEGTFILRIYSYPGVSGTEFPALNINHAPFDKRRINLNPNASNPPDIVIKRSGNQISLDRVVLRPPAQPYQPPQQVPQTVPYATEPSPATEEKQ